jgi:hypothetical protein
MLRRLSVRDGSLFLVGDRSVKIKKRPILPLNVNERSYTAYCGSLCLPSPSDHPLSGFFFCFKEYFEV